MLNRRVERTGDTRVNKGDKHRLPTLCSMCLRTGVAEWLVHRSGDLGEPSLSHPTSAADFLVITEWPVNTHMLPIADNLHRWTQGSSMSLKSRGVI